MKTRNSFITMRGNHKHDDDDEHRRHRYQHEHEIVSGHGHNDNLPPLLSQDKLAGDRWDRAALVAMLAVAFGFGILLVMVFKP